MHIDISFTIQDYLCFYTGGILPCLRSNNEKCSSLSLFQYFNSCRANRNTLDWVSISCRTDINLQIYSIGDIGRTYELQTKRSRTSHMEIDPQAFCFSATTKPLWRPHWSLLSYGHLKTLDTKAGTHPGQTSSHFAVSHPLFLLSHSWEKVSTS